MRHVSKIFLFSEGSAGLLAALAVLSIAASPAGAGSIDPALEKNLGKGAPDARYRVVVKFRDGAGRRAFTGQPRRERKKAAVRELKAVAEQSHLELKVHLDVREEQGAVGNRKALWIMNGAAMTATAEAIRELAARPEVDGITQDRVIALGISAPANAGVSAGWNLARIGALPVRNAGHSGQGVVIASLDTGVDASHPDLGTQWRGGTNSWYDPNGEHPAPADVTSGPASGHGTQTMGIMVGSSTGVAPGAQWIAAKIFNDSGQALISNIHLAFQWVLDPDGDADTDDAADVVNCSWDLDAPGSVNEEFRPDIQALRAAGIGLVFSAGNSGPLAATSVSPANYPESFSVGMTDNVDAVAFGSSRGPSAWDGVSVYPSLVAPGTGITTTDLMFGLTAPRYRAVSGSSFSAPHAAGGMALLLSADPALTAEQLEAALTQTAWDLGSAGPDNSYGSGFLDLERSARQLGILPPPIPGDLDGNGSLGLPDILGVLRTATGLVTSAVELERAEATADVFPAAGDGAITAGDALTLLRSFVGAGAH